MTLAEFLLARIAEDEYEAKVRSIGRGWRKQWLAECEGKRRIVGLSLTNDNDWGAEQSTRYLALPYADHPDYREEWKP